MSERWVKAYRIPPEHPLRLRFGAFGVGAWYDLIVRARWQDETGLRRGQLRGTVRTLAKDWSGAESKVSKDRVHRFLRFLEREGMIVWERPPNRHVPGRITVSNYGHWQQSADARTDGRDAGATLDATKDATEARRTSGGGDETCEPSGDAGATLDATEDASQPRHHNRSRSIRRTSMAHARSAHVYPDAFEEAWTAYPRRAGGNPKKLAFKAWRARLRERVDGRPITTEEELLAAVKRYAAHIRAIGKEGTEYVMQAATFFGPNERWREDYTLPGEHRAGPQYERRGLA